MNSFSSKLTEIDWSPITQNIACQDDSNFFVTEKNVATSMDIMNKELSKIIEWLHTKKLSLNVNKTQ